MKVSVIIPVLNEEHYIMGLLKCIEEQDFDPNEVEYLFLDGGSTDNTNYFIDTYNHLRPHRIIANPNRTQAWAMNVGTAAARGEIIIRMDAHAEYPSNYVSECVKALEAGLGDNVGGYAITQGKGELGPTIAKLLSSKFGVGNSQFRTSVESGEVDTVPFGCFYKSYLEKIGGFDTRLDRNEDNEINHRIHQLGGKVYLSNTIHFVYYCRNTISGLCAQAMGNGQWNVITMKLIPGSMGIRHFVPFVFFLSVVCLSVLSFVHHAFLMLFGLEFALYFTLAMVFASQAADSFKEGLILTFLFPMFHFCYGYGSFKGLLKLNKY